MIRTDYGCEKSVYSMCVSVGLYISQQKNIRVSRCGRKIWFDLF